jgi:hypothetical protein
MENLTLASFQWSLSRALGINRAMGLAMKAANRFAF